MGREFYDRPTLRVARELLGQRLVRVVDGVRLSGLIVEAEAYIGEEDAACHASRGRTPRTEVMYGPPGHVYIYFTYGMHHCFNVVTEREGFPAAALIRALEPQEGHEEMRHHRGHPPDEQLTNGPGKLCQALVIDRSLNGLDLCTSDLLFIEGAEDIASSEIEATPRIGIRADEIAKERPWRFLWRRGRSII